MTRNLLPLYVNESVVLIIEVCKLWRTAIIIRLSSSTDIIYYYLVFITTPLSPLIRYTEIIITWRTANNYKTQTKIRRCLSMTTKTMKRQQQRRAITTKIVQSARFVKNDWDVGVSVWYVLIYLFCSGCWYTRMCVVHRFLFSRVPSTSYHVHHLSCTTTLQNK